MDQKEYERPRERLRRQGAQSLAFVELMQVIIGSGNAGHSGARIAKNITALTQSPPNQVTYEDLIRINGVGDAKACLVLASIELGSRLLSDSSVTKIPLDVSALRNASKFSIICEFISSEGIVIGSFIDTLGNEAKAVRVLKGLFTEALARNARSIVVALGCKRQDVHTLSTTFLGVARKLYDTADLLEIHVTSLSVVGKLASKQITRKATV